MKYFLLPFSLIFGLGVFVRNKMFDWKLLRSVKFDVPLIIVGNLRIGGTGKTPHVEWLLSMLSEKYRLAVLSRGYGRKTKGYLEVRTDSCAIEVGDEPLQIKRKFPNIPVVVCEDRVVAITELLADYELDAVILDDAFQHRYITPSFSLILSASDKPFFKDWFLPFGRLREAGGSLRRAHALIYTKSNGILSSDQKSEFRSKAHKFQSGLSVYFSTYGYASPISISNREDLIVGKKVIALSGIADSDSFTEYVKEHYILIEHLKYSDHYNFTASDIVKWKTLAENNPEAVILTTEKDTTRLLAIKEAKELPIFYLPITVQMQNEKDLLESIEQAIHRT